MEEGSNTSLPTAASRASAHSMAASDGSPGGGSARCGEDEAFLPEIKETEAGPLILGCFPFYVDDVLRLKVPGKKLSRAHCVGPVMELTLWSPVVHAFVMVFFGCLGAELSRERAPSFQAGDYHHFSHPSWWFLVVGCICTGLMYLEVRIAMYSSTWYSGKAAATQNTRMHESHAEGSLKPSRPPIRWPCIPVQMTDCLLRLCRVGWQEDREDRYFNIWFVWLFGISAAALFSRIQANSFLGMLSYRYMVNYEHGKMVEDIWKDTLRQSYFMKGLPVSIGTILIMVVLAQICHYLFGVLCYWPRRRWRTTDHMRWHGGDGTWMVWGRSFEFRAKGIESHEESVADSSAWKPFWEGFKGGPAEARSANGGRIFLTAPAGGPAYRDNAEYSPADEDFPMTVKLTTNRHAYTALSGEELTSSSVMDGIAECCSMQMLLNMQLLELQDFVKVHEFLRKYKEDPTPEMAGEIIQAVRSLMNDAVNVSRHVFSRVFIYGICFCGIHLHLQVTYTNTLCANKPQCESGQDLWLGIVSAFVSMLLVLLKIMRITKYYWKVWSVVKDSEAALLPEHAALGRFKSMRDQSRRAIRKLTVFSVAMVPACLMFVWNLTWLLSKWVMGTFVCPSHVWNVPSPTNATNIMSGCAVF